MLLHERLARDGQGVSILTVVAPVLRQRLPQIRAAVEDPDVADLFGDLLQPHTGAFLQDAPHAPPVVVGNPGAHERTCVRVDGEEIHENAVLAKRLAGDPVCGELGVRLAEDTQTFEFTQRTLYCKVIRALGAIPILNRAQS